MNYRKEVERYRSQIISDTQTMIQIPSKKGLPEEGAPFGKDLKHMLDWILQKAENDGFSIHNYDGYVGRLEYGEGEKTVGVLCHLDVVPEQKNGWEFPPYGGMVKDNVIYGRGSNDNKGPTMAVYYALQMLKDHGYIPKHKLHMIFGCDEEGNMECMDYYHKHTDVLPDFGFVPDCTFPMNYGEHGLYALQIHLPLPKDIEYIRGGNHPHIVCDQIETKLNTNKEVKDLFTFYKKSMEMHGSFTLQEDTLITLTGTPAHGSRPFNGKNAACALFNFLGNAYDIDVCKKLAHLLSDWQGKPLGISCRDMKYGELSICITQVETIKDEVVITIDIRYPFHLDKHEVLQNIKDILLSEIANCYITRLEDRDGCYNDPDSPMVKKLEDIYRTQTLDEKTPIKVSPGDTYARKFDNFVAYGPTTAKHLQMKHIGQAHQCDEGMEIDTLLDGCAIYAEALAYLLDGTFHKK